MIPRDDNHLMELMTETLRRRASSSRSVPDGQHVASALDALEEAVYHLRQLMPARREDVVAEEAEEIAKKLGQLDFRLKSFWHRFRKSSPSSRRTVDDD